MPPRGGACAAAAAPYGQTIRRALCWRRRRADPAARRPTPHVWPKTAGPQGTAGAARNRAQAGMRRRGSPRGRPGAFRGPPAEGTTPGAPSRTRMRGSGARRGPPRRAPRPSGRRPFARAPPRLSRGSCSVGEPASLPGFGRADRGVHGPPLRAGWPRNRGRPHGSLYFGRGPAARACNHGPAPAIAGARDAPAYARAGSECRAAS